MEHWRSKNNSFGLFVIDGSNAKGWDKIDQIVKNYCDVHKQEVEDIVNTNKWARETRANKYASGKKIRWSGSLPPGLMIALEKAEPNLFKQKELSHKFFKKYKKFSTCKVI